VKFRRQLRIGDVVALIGLNDAYPKLGTVREIGNNIVAVHKTAGALPFHNLAIHDQTIWVPKAAIFDPQSWAGWLKAMWYATRKASS
jgi:hypothetical protein